MTILEPELGAIAGPDVAAVADACASSQVTFVRHLAASVATVTEPDVVAVAEAARRAVGERGLRSVALQAWRAGDHDLAAEDVRAAAARHLADDGVDVRRSGCAVNVGLCLAASGAHVCVTPAHLALSDWPGGRIRLARRAERISRSEFKLEELFTLVPPPDGRGRRALDLGASPGGWTRVLRARGFEVWAVDTGALHPSLASDPLVRPFAKTAGRFLAETDVGEGFDVIVNDMRMVPATSCDLMVAAARRVVPGGTIVVTLKVDSRSPVRDVRRSLGSLGRAYEVVFARQLFHNRNEVTVVAQRPSDAAGQPRITTR
ncbi:MAG TPA: SAM-dependent methyltransferase [Acidimicrobiales bacterium]